MYMILFFKNIDFNNAFLQSSSLITDRITGFVFGMSAKTDNKTYKSHVDIVADAIKDSDAKIQSPLLFPKVSFNALKLLILKFMTIKRCFIFFLIIGLASCKSSRVNLEGLTFKEQLQALFPKAEISNIRAAEHFKEAYQLVLKQPLDHNDPRAGSFDHYIYVSHSDYESPTVLITEGYNAKPQTYELSKILESNQVMVE